ncbi:glutaredoxin family protein [Patescibacteria group bacterium]
MQKIQVYSTPTCAYCVMVKDWLKEKNIEFEEFDVSVDEEKRNELIAKTGQLAVPVIIIGNDAVVGFDKAKLSELLGVK